MPLFAIICHDKPGVLEKRLAIRPEHLAYLDSQEERLVHVGPLMTDDEQPVGSLFIIDVADFAAAEAFAAGDPFARQGVFGQTEIRRTRKVYPKA